MQIALMRLDGLGGTVTLSDQAEKVYQLTGEPVVLITRGYADLFRDNPHISRVINVGYEDWAVCFNKYCKPFDVFCDIKFIVGRWYFNSSTLPAAEINWYRWETLYRLFPLLRSPEAKAAHDLDIYDLNQTQIVDMSLGLPFSTIDCKVFADTTLKTVLPESFILINNGVDIQHKDMRQTKMYPYWDQLVSLLPPPVVQVGTPHDVLVKGVHTDLRGKTTLLEFIYLLRKAGLVLCCEGGTMHLAYAAGSKNVVVIRGPSAGPINKYPSHVTVDSYVCTNCWWQTGDWHCRCMLGIDNVCMRSISPERVAFIVNNLLEG